MLQNNLHWILEVLDRHVSNAGTDDVSVQVLILETAAL